MNDLKVIRDAFARTVRLVSTARLRPPVLLDLGDQDELEALAEIEGATSARRMGEDRGSQGVDAHEFVHGVPHANVINAAFAYAKPRAPNRFNGANRGAWYAALETRTSLAEVAFHMTRVLADAGDFNAVVEYAEMFASLAGEFADLRGSEPAPDCLHPDPHIGYPAGNALAEETRARGLNGIIYPSVRHPGGTCFAVLWPHAVQSVAQGGVIRLTWSGEWEPAVEAV